MNSLEELSEIDKQLEAWKEETFGKDGMVHYWPAETYAKLTFMIKYYDELLDDLLMK